MFDVKNKKKDLLLGIFLGLTLYNVIFAFNTDFYQLQNGVFNAMVKVIMLIIGLISIMNAINYLNLDSNVSNKSRLRYLSSAITVFSLLYIFMTYIL